MLCFLALISCESSRSEERQNDLVRTIGIGLLGIALPSPFDSFAETNIDRTRFLGTWREIQRIDTSFQRGLVRSGAQYSSLGGNLVEVRNTGFRANGEEVSLTGLAVFPNETQARLKVSFLPPFFFGDFIILRVDRQNYQTALIGGPTPNFLWVFSRAETMDSNTLNQYIAFAESIGYNVRALQAFR